MKISSFLIILLSFCFINLNAAAFDITAEGQPRCAIITGENPPETVIFAARELQSYIEKISGVKLLNVTEPQPDLPSLRLGPAATVKISANDIGNIRRDGYHIEIIDGDLCIAGLDDTGGHTDIDELLEKGITHDVTAWTFQRGTLYGVYRLLEEIGVRWFMPGEFGERVPDLPSINFRGRIVENPHFITRTVGYWSMNSARCNKRPRESKVTILPGENEDIGFTAQENRMWELRMRGESFRIPLNHNPVRLRWFERFGESNPEYFALKADGERDLSRHGHLCYTHPQVVENNILDIKAYGEGAEASARGIETTFRFNRNWSYDIALGRYFSVLPNDGFRACLCPVCKAQFPDDKVPNAQRYSRLIWDFVAKCAQGASEMNVVCLAYGNYSMPYPEMAALPPNVIVGFTAMTHPASLYYRDDLAVYERRVAEWADLTHGSLAFWQHYLASNRNEETGGMPEHTPAIYAQVARIMARHGNHVFCEQMADSIYFELFNRYLLLKIFYNPQLDEREIFQDYVMQFYGPDAGPLIGEIYDDIEVKSIERFQTRASGYGVWERLFSEKTMQSYLTRADEARRLAAGTIYERAVDAFRRYYLGLMERGRSRHADPLANLLTEFNPVLGCARSRKPVAIDGILDEPVWQTAESVVLGNTVNGRATRPRTEVKVAYDSDHLYMAAIVAEGDKAPADEAAPKSMTSESIAIYLDPSMLRQGFYRVTVERSGIINDYRYIDGILLEDPNWNSDARASVRDTGKGYAVELAIPLKSLDMEDVNLRRREWASMIVRSQSRPSNPDDKFSTTSLLLRGRLEQPTLFNTLQFSR